jgi:hypothetical protein
VDLEFGARAKHAVAIFYADPDAYGFHLLEGLQCMVERRQGGETGVAAVQVQTGEAMWRAIDEGGWAGLLEAALGVSERRVPGDPRVLAKEPAVLLIEYRDGLRAAVCLLGGVTSQRAFAAEVALPGRAHAETVATRFGEQGPEPYGHFAWLCEKIQDMICTGRAVQPVERTLLTTGILDRVMESRWRGNVRLETPELAVRY